MMHDVNGTAADDDPTGLRAFLFGDAELDRWPDAATPATGEPWQSFERARAATRAGDDVDAAAIWHEIAASADDPRNVLQAWHFLRGIGRAPQDAEASRALGVVVEVAVDGGHDLLAAYPGGAVRYLNVGGAAVVIEPGPEEAGDITVLVEDLVRAGQTVADVIGPWTDPPLPNLPPGHSRITVLTPSGPHLGQGPDEALRADGLASGVFDRATRLLLAVIEVASSG